MGELNCRFGTMLMNPVGNGFKIIQNIILQAHLVIKGTATGFDRTIRDRAQSNAAPGKSFMELTQAFSIRPPARTMSFKSSGFDKTIGQLERPEGPRGKRVYTIGIDAVGHGLNYLNNSGRVWNTRRTQLFSIRRRLQPPSVSNSVFNGDLRSYQGLAGFFHDGRVC